MPTMRTACGSPAKYFRGIAMPSNTRKEMPSRNAMIRRRPNADLISSDTIENQNRKTHFTGKIHIKLLEMQEVRKKLLPGNITF